jgi:diguanylate cyclase (GGDEF)-like protein
MSLRDPLTGLFNRRYVDDRLPALLDRAREEAASVSVAIADIDHFKRISDSVSHDTGDEVLRRLAPVLQSATGAGFAARMGGEEFLLVIPGLDAPAAVKLCDSLRLDIRDHPWHLVVGDLPVTISIGVVTTLAGADTSGEMLAEAGRRLYVSKRGRSRPGHRRLTRA